jgi:hypothetical protein
MKIVIPTITFIFGLIIGLMIESKENMSTDVMPLKAVSNAKALEETILSAYMEGDHYTIISHMRTEDLSKEMRGLLARALSWGAGSSEGKEFKSQLIPWDDFENSTGIPGSFKGKKLSFIQRPIGVIELSSSDAKSGTKYTIHLAYFSAEGQYRLCDITTKKQD